MPLEEKLRESIHEYCVKDLPGDLQWHIDQFSFVKDDELKSRLGRAFYSSRYIGKLMEAVSPAQGEIHSFIKFQIIQYASIYEAVVSYLLWTHYVDHPELKLLQTHKAYKPVSALGSLTEMTYDGQKLFPCVYRDTKTPRNSIPFRDKVDCAVRIGFIEVAYAEDIKLLYGLRNLAHIEAEAEEKIELEIKQSRIGYWRIKPFLDRIVAALSEDPA